eukprot:527304_1
MNNYMLYEKLEILDQDLNEDEEKLEHEKEYFLLSGESEEDEELTDEMIMAQRDAQKQTSATEFIASKDAEEENKIQNILDDDEPIIHADEEKHVMMDQLTKEMEEQDLHKVKEMERQKKIDKINQLEKWIIDEYEPSDSVWSTVEAVTDEYGSDWTTDEYDSDWYNDTVKLIIVAKERLGKFIYKYSLDYVDDGTMWIPFDELLKLTKDIDITTKMGVYFWSLVLDKQSQRAYDVLWPVLRYVAHELPTPVAVELVKLYQVPLSKYPPMKFEGITRAIVESSAFGIATALTLAAFFDKLVQKDLANTRILRTYSENYQNIAVKKLREIENDYLASIIVMTRSFHNSKTPYEIAIENELTTFLACDSMCRIVHAMWIKRHLLQKKISENAFDVKPNGILQIVQLLPNPRDFYFTPMGFHFIETFLFCIYLGLVTVITLNKQSVDETLQWYDWLLFACNLGYILNELIQCIKQGIINYFHSWENIFDSILSVIWTIIMFLRILATTLLEVTTEYSFLNLLFTGLWTINIILLWMRCLYFLMMSAHLAPIINAMVSMTSSLKNWFCIFLVVTFPFTFGMHFLFGEFNVYFKTQLRSFVFLTLAALGRPNWSYVHNGDIHNLNIINSWVIILYSIVGYVLLINLLISMMIDAYEDHAEKHWKAELLKNKATLSFKLDSFPKIMPPPMNSIVFIFFVVYNLVDILLLILTGEFLNEQGFSKFWRCRNKECKFLNSKSVIDEYVKQGWNNDFPCDLCDQLHTMDDIYKSSKRRFR